MAETDVLLKSWQNFYVIAGSAAAALTGLVFVVITIISGDNDRPRSAEGTAIFTTPTVVHFGASLLIAMLLSMPLRHVVYVAVPLCAIGISGVAYILRTTWRMQHLESYTADAEDNLWHVTLPLIAYGAIAAGGCTLVPFAPLTMYAFALGSALLLFIGIHNAWDIVTFLTVQAPDAGEKEPATSSSPGAPRQ